MRTFTAILFALASLTFLSPALPQALAQTCSSGSDFWNPRPGATITITSEACGTVDSNGLFKVESHTVTCSSTDANLQSQSGFYEYYGTHGTVLVYFARTDTGLGACPNDSRTFHKKDVGCATTVFLLNVKDLSTGATDTLFADATAQAPAETSCVV